MNISSSNIQPLRLIQPQPAFHSLSQRDITHGNLKPSHMTYPPNYLLHHCAIPCRSISFHLDITVYKHELVQPPAKYPFLQADSLP